MILDAFYVICVDFSMSGWINVPKKYSKSSEAVNFRGFFYKNHTDGWINNGWMNELLDWMMYLLHFFFDSQN